MSVKGEIEERVAELLEPILEEEGLELYDVEWHPAGKHSYLKIFIDREGGVTLGDCERVSLQIGDILDVEDLIPSRYFLEVSSPGLTRELKKEGHYRRSLGCSVRVVLKSGRTLVGTLSDVVEGGFVLTTGEGDVQVSYEDVARARLEFEDR